MAEKPFVSWKGMDYRRMYAALRDDTFHHPDLALRGWAEEQQEIGRQDAIAAIAAMPNPRKLHAR